MNDDHARAQWWEYTLIIILGLALWVLLVYGFVAVVTAVAT